MPTLFTVPRRALLAGAVFAATVAAAAAPALLHAQTFPTKPVRIVVPAAAGGNLDLIARAVGQKMGDDLKQSVIGENRPGAALLPGTQYAAKQPPDGYTLLGNSNTTVTAPVLMANAGYDPLRDFTGIGPMARVPMLLVVGPAVPANTVQEFVKLIREKPDTVTGATAGGGSSSHIGAELFFQQAGARTLLVPYKGNSPALIDIVAGRVGYIFDAVTTTVQFVKSGQLRALGATGQTRSVLLPNVPTIAEAGLAGYQTEIFNGLAAPAGTPREVVRRLHASLQRAVANPELQQQFGKQGVELATNRTHEEFDAFLRNEVERYTRLAKSANIKVD